MVSRLRWLKQTMQLALLVVLFVLAGCTICPPSTDQWRGQIEEKPEKIKLKDPRLEPKTEEIDEKKGLVDTISELMEPDEDPTIGDWYWQDGSREWSYTGQEKPNAPADQWLYEKRSLALRISASDNLNPYLGQPHTVSMKVFQLSDPAIISELRESPYGLADLMAQRGSELSDSILREDRIDIAPGETKSLILDREQGAKYIAVVTGFFEMNGKRAVRLMAIPAVKPRILPCYDPLPWPIGAEMPPTPSNVPGRLKVWLELEQNSVTNVEARVL